MERKDDGQTTLRVQRRLHGRYKVARPQKDLSKYRAPRSERIAAPVEGSHLRTEGNFLFHFKKASRPKQLYVVVVTNPK